MLIEVTRDDIRRGHPEDDCRCPVSLAIRRAVGLDTSVGDGVIVVDYATPWQIEIWSPEEVIQFVEDFDAGRKVKPFAFELDLPDGWEEQRQTTMSAYRTRQEVE